LGSELCLKPPVSHCLHEGPSDSKESCSEVALLSTSAIQSGARLFAAKHLSFLLVLSLANDIKHSLQQKGTTLCQFCKE
jgi:hypothetical protein